MFIENKINFKFYWYFTIAACRILVSAQCSVENYRLAHKQLRWHFSAGAIKLCAKRQSDGPASGWNAKYCIRPGASCLPELILSRRSWSHNELALKTNLIPQRRRQSIKCSHCPWQWSEKDEEKLKTTHPPKKARHLHAYQVSHVKLVTLLKCAAGMQMTADLTGSAQ